MRDDFAAFILTHGRPNSVHTYKSLRSSGYTGRIFLVVDDEDKTVDEYRELYGDEVLQFSKAEIEKTFDTGDNFKDKRGVIVYARNACFGLARKVGVRYFIQLDDDYCSWFYRYDRDMNYGSFRIKKTMDLLFESIVDFLSSTTAKTICLSQGGDHIGGRKKSIGLKRKAMNTFVCDVERPFKFMGRINEDVNTYTLEGLRGNIFLTVMNAQVNQLLSQSNEAGMTGVYLDGGTYLKTFYSVLYSPSCVKVDTLAGNYTPHRRIHHRVNWNAATPKILREEHRKASREHSAIESEPVGVANG